MSYRIEDYCRFFDCESARRHGKRDGGENILPKYPDRHIHPPEKEEDGWGKPFFPLRMDWHKPLTEEEREKTRFLQEHFVGCWVKASSMLCQLLGIDTEKGMMSLIVSDGTAMSCPLASLALY